MTTYEGDGAGPHWPGQNVALSKAEGVPSGTRSDRRKAIERANEDAIAQREIDEARAELIRSGWLIPPLNRRCVPE